jgi:hypothetical protein
MRRKNIQIFICIERCIFMSVCERGRRQRLGPKHQQQQRQKRKKNYHLFIYIYIYK